MAHSKLGGEMKKVLFILGQLTDEDVNWLAANGSRRIIKKGEVLIEESKHINSLYFLLDGHMSVSTKSSGELAMLGCGEIMGEMSLVDSLPTSATVVAADDCVVLEVSNNAIQEKMGKDIHFAAHFYRAIATFLSDRVRGTVSRLGYGKDVWMKDDAELEGELNTYVLDNVHLAGARFDRMLQKLMGRM